MKIVLAGSPSISVPAFEQVMNNFDVVAVVTQPDKPKGRGLKLESTDVAKLAEKHNIKTFKPNKIIEIYDELKDLDFDLMLSFAYGQIIPEKILGLGKFKPLNIHGSILPKYRGAAPIHYAILNGDSEIGITLMEMIKQMDAGDMYFIAKKEINENTTTGDGFKIISELAEKNIVSWLNRINNGDYTTTKQPDNFTVAPKISKEFCELNLGMDVNEAIRKIKGLNPFPGAYIILNNKRVKIFDACGKNKPNSIPLKFNDGVLFACDYQYESKKRVRL